MCHQRWTTLSPYINLPKKDRPLWVGISSWGYLPELWYLDVWIFCNFLRLIFRQPSSATFGRIFSQIPNKLSTENVVVIWKVLSSSLGVKTSHDLRPMILFGLLHDPHIQDIEGLTIQPNGKSTMTSPQNIVWRYIVMQLSCHFQNIAKISISLFFENITRY